MLRKLRILFTFTGIMLLLGAIFTDEWASVGDRFSYAILAICMLIVCQPAHFIRFSHWVWASIKSLLSSPRNSIRSTNHNRAEDDSSAAVGCSDPDPCLVPPLTKTSRKNAQQIIAEAKRKSVQRQVVKPSTNTNLCEVQSETARTFSQNLAEHPAIEESNVEADELTATSAIPDNVQSSGTDTTDAAAEDNCFDDLVVNTDPDEAQPNPTSEIQPIPAENPALEESEIDSDKPTDSSDTPDETQTTETATTCTATEDGSSSNLETYILDCIRDPQIMSHYIVLDIETTGFSRENDRIIEIAAIHYVFGEEAKRFHTYVNPQIPVPKHITKLTGIRQSDVDNAPLLEDIADDFLEFINGYPIVGHNIVNFDLPFLASHMELNEMPLVIDTLDLSRLVFPMLPSHKLSNLNYWFELDKGASHRADADAAATNALLWACLYPDKYASLYKKAVRNGLPETRQTDKPKPHHYPDHFNISEIKPSQNQSITPGPLTGKKIVFTGELSISRKEAAQLAIDAGAVVRTSVSGKTNYLVVGKQDLSVVGSDGMSAKQEKALEINASGKGCIKVIDESEFMALIEAKPVEQY